MLKMPTTLISIVALFLCAAPFAQARDNPNCHDSPRPIISFVEFPSVDLTPPQPTPLTVKGKLKLPVRFSWRHRCFLAKRNLRAVVILHGSAGVDSRGDFYARALNAAGIATLEIDMWEARGVETAADRPPLPLFTYPDAFAALGFLSTIDDIDPDRIGVLGFSWGGVITMASAEQLYADQFGQGLKFAAHAAHYPICYIYNANLLGPPAQLGTQWLNLTGAPVLIQIGTEDDYDNGADNCIALVDDLSPSDRDLVEVVPRDGARHAWDRLQVAISVFDPFGDEGSGVSNLPDGPFPEVRLTPNVEQAYASRRRVVKFFRRNL